MFLLSNSTGNTKMRKDEKENYLSYSLNLLPHKNTIGGKTVNLCPWAGKCSDPCVGKGGHFGMKNGTAYHKQYMNTLLFTHERELFFTRLVQDLKQVAKIQAKKNKKVAIRLNAYSDLNFHKLSKRYLKECIFEMFLDIQFYDYTKDVKKFVENNKSNYHLTYSHDEKGKFFGSNTAVVFEELPKTYKGLPVFDGDITDLRFLDPENHIIGLKFKGSKAKLLSSIGSGFCIPKVDVGCIY